jgi:hypothetical protein
LVGKPTLDLDRARADVPARHGESSTRVLSVYPASGFKFRARATAQLQHRCHAATAKRSLHSEGRGAIILAAGGCCWLDSATAGCG